tara:strand:+ start:72632 stop:73324 length:693 start_codon:yes stop_codon:yes gene_type:complete
MEKNKTGKYFKYAIGEIILVVIGILIALNINNWNEEKKSIQKGRDILVDIKENLEFNTIQFQDDIEINRNVVNSIDIILNNITVTKIYNDSLGKHIRYVNWWASARWKSSGYEALVKHGVEIVQSKELQESIIDLYEISYIEIVENARLQEGNWNAILPNWLELIYRDPSDFNSSDEHKARPFDYQEIVDSRMFRSFLTFNRSQRVYDIQVRASMLAKHQEIIKLINKEL